MKLSEGKLFTIEALNRIEGFEWPERATWARLDSVVSDKVIHFFSDDTWIKSVNYYIDNPKGFGIHTGVNRAEFESVDGWVRHNNGDMPVDEDSVVQVKLHFDAISQCFPMSEFNWKDGDIEYWRYAKQQKQAKQLTTQLAHSIESLISQHKAARLSKIEARRLLENAEAAEHNLLLSIEAWAESQGFDIRLLDESEEEPELVVTDWRDLEIGDVVQWTLRNGDEFTVYELFRDSEGGNPCATIKAGDAKLYNVYDGEIKFIRRPAK